MTFDVLSGVPAMNERALLSNWQLHSPPISLQVSNRRTNLLPPLSAVAFFVFFLLHTSPSITTQSNVRHGDFTASSVPPSAGNGHVSFVRLVFFIAFTLVENLQDYEQRACYPDIEVDGSNESTESHLSAASAFICVSAISYDTITFRTLSDKFARSRNVIHSRDHHGR